MFPFSISSPLTSDNSSIHEVFDIPADSVTVTSLPTQIQTPAPTLSTPQVPAQAPPASNMPTTAPTATTSTAHEGNPTPDVAPAPTSDQTTSVLATAAPSEPPKRTSNRLRKPIQKLNLTATVVPISEKIPTSVAEALKDPRWRKAMYDELEAMARNRTWDLTDAAAAANIVGCKWVFTIKRHPDGSIDRFKA